MPKPAKIMERVRAHGANICLEGGKLKIHDGKKLPAEAKEIIKANARAIADWLEDEAAYEERAAILEYDGGLTRAVAEGMAKIQLAHPPAGADPADWSWYVDQASRIMDAHLARAA